MPKLQLYSLTFRAGLHIGRHGIGQEKVLAHVPADTLFAALATIRQQWQGDAGSWAAGFESEPPFLLTSAFPYAGGVRFFPRPQRMPGGIDPKRWRKISFVSEGIFRRLLGNNLPESYHPKPPGEEPQNGLTLQKGNLWLSKEEIALLPETMRTKPDKKGGLLDIPPRAVERHKAWEEMTVPRVTVDRLTNGSDIYHTGRIIFTPGCGLWFGVQGLGEPQQEELLSMLTLLGDSGIGAERSVGYGAFTVTAEDKLLVLPDPRPKGMLLLLSRFYPCDTEDAKALTGSSAAYELIYVAGRVQTLGQANQRRQGIHLVTEGSLVGGSARGGLAEVSPKVGKFPHKVYRYGLALGAGMEVEK